MRAPIAQPSIRSTRQPVLMRLIVTGTVMSVVSRAQFARLLV
jgi:hypothetical protein